MYVPQVDVFVRDLHGALAVDVQVRGGHQVHVETLWRKNMGKKCRWKYSHFIPYLMSCWQHSDTTGASEVLAGQISCLWSSGCLPAVVLSF